MLRPPTPTTQAVRRLRHRSYSHAQTIVFAGRREMGKTTALSDYLEEREPRVLFVDQFKEQRRLRWRADADVAFDELEEGGPCRRRISPPPGAAPHEWLEDLLYRRVVNGRCRNFLLGIDELNRVCKPMPNYVVPGPWLTEMCLQGRKYGVRTIVATQDLSLVPGILLSEVTDMLFFRTVRPENKERAGKWLGNETAETLDKLKVGECVALLEL